LAARRQQLGGAVARLFVRFRGTLLQAARGGVAGLAEQAIFLLGARQRGADRRTDRNADRAHEQRLLLQEAGKPLSQAAALVAHALARMACPLAGMAHALAGLAHRIADRMPRAGGLLAHRACRRLRGLHAALEASFRAFEPALALRRR